MWMTIVDESNHAIVTNDSRLCTGNCTVLYKGDSKIEAEKARQEFFAVDHVLYNYIEDDVNDVESDQFFDDEGSCYQWDDV